jgi:hypothetical protein
MVSYGGYSFERVRSLSTTQIKALVGQADRPRVITFDHHLLNQGTAWILRCPNIACAHIPMCRTGLGQESGDLAEAPVQHTFPDKSLSAREYLTFSEYAP